jgi:hypothetical protein
MSLAVLSILDGVVSHAMALGRFERVNAHEPKNAPGHGLTAAVWLQSLDPLGAASGLAVTSGRLEFTGRIYQNMLMEPADMIDPLMMEAADAWLGALSGDFELGGNVRNIDLLGAHGTPLSGRAAYINVSGVMFRIFDLTIPLIVNDVWSQSG